MFLIKPLRYLGLVVVLFLTAGCPEQAQNNRDRHEEIENPGDAKKSKVLFVITGTNFIEKTGEKTGFTLTEAAQPWLVFNNAKYEVDFMSPKGGLVTVDSMNFTDQGDRIFWNDQGVQAKLKNTLAPDKVALVDYMAVYFVGGHGAMWDFPDNEDVKKLAADMYEKGGIVGSVCHGAAALINVKLSTGEFLIKGKNLTGFTNSEEKEVKKDAVVPFLLETALIKSGAKFQAKPNWQANVQVADRLVTGQNPASSKGVGEAMVKLLDQIQAR
jgi:putative intracellular protease/amidase